MQLPSADGTKLPSAGGSFLVQLRCLVLLRSCIVLLRKLSCKVLLRCLVLLRSCIVLLRKLSCILLLRAAIARVCIPID